MDIINIDMNQVEKKYSQLIAQKQQSKQTKSISQVIQAITQKKILVKDVIEYLAHCQDYQQKTLAERISQNWKASSIDEIKKLLNNVIIYKNKLLQSKSQPSQKSPQKKKTKSKNDAHQNPYIPQKIQPSKKSTIKQQNVTNNINQQENHINITLEQKEIKQNCQQQQQVEIEQFHQKNSDNNNQKISDQQEQHLFHLDNNSNDPNTNDQLTLPQNFKSLPVQQRYSILSKKHGKNKKILQKRFDMIYKHYRKEMYIPYESFQINNQLLMDLRIFLKYFKDFDMNKKFKTNQALKHFKKIAINGLWLDDKNFIFLHYKLIDLLDTNLLLQNFDSTDPNKVNQMKKETVKNIKHLKENLKKLNQLSQLVSEDKMKQVFRTGKTQTIVKKIIESHSGLSQQDVMLKLKERAELRKNKKAQINSNEKVSTWSPDKSKFTKTNDATSKRSQLLHEMSIYKQIQLPKFRSREMRSSSIYSSLQILNIQKEKQKLRQLVRQKDNERYLKQFFKKQKNSPILCRSNSLNVVRSSSIKDQTQLFSMKSSRVSRKSGLPQISLLKRNFSLPRMRFT